jgi:hypothetical protein
MDQPLRGIALVALLLAFAVHSVALAATTDCMQIDRDTAASILGVSAERMNVNNQQGRHTKLPPDDVNLLTCGYLVDVLSGSVRTLSYSIYTPIPRDAANIFASLSKGNFPRAQSFSPSVGGRSTGWYRGNQFGNSGNLFEGQLTMLTGSTIVIIRIANLSSSAAVEDALVRAAKYFSKS